MRYLLFAGGDFYYAKGGGHDYIGSGDSVRPLVEDARDAEDFYAWWHVYCTVECKIVAGSRYQAHGVND